MQWILTRKGFRRFLWLQILFMVALLIIDIFLDECCNHPLLKEYNESILEYQPPLAYNAYLLVLSVASVVSLVGLFRFKDYGRQLTLIITLVGAAKVFLAGHPAFWLSYSPYTDGLFGWMDFLGGFTLALIYFSPLKDEFK